MQNTNKIYPFVNKIIGIIGVFVLFLLAMLAFFFQSRVSMEKLTIEKVSFHKNSILVYIFLFFLVAGLFLWRKKIEKINPRKLFLFLAAILFFCGIVLVFGAGTDLRADALQIYESAKGILQGDFSALEKGNYLYHYPHQLGMVSYEWVLLKIVNNVEIIFFINLLFILFNVYLLGEICFILFRNQFVHNVTLLLSFFFLPQLFFILFAYGTIPGFSMLLAAFYFQFRFLQKNKIKYLFLSIVFACLSCLLKNNYLIGILTSCIVYFLYALKKRKCKYMVYAVISILCVIGSGKLLILSYENISNEHISAGEPKILWVAMGLRDESPILGGWYDEYNKQTYIDCEYDSKAASDKAKDSIKKSIKTFVQNPEYAIDFFQDKIESTWCDPLYQSIWSGPLEACGQTLNDQSLKRIYSDGFWHSVIRDFCGAEQIFIYITTLTFAIKCFRSRNTGKPEILMGLIFLIGGFWFHLIWETKSQYVYPYVFFLLPYSAHMFSEGSSKFQVFLNRKTYGLQKEEMKL